MNLNYGCSVSAWLEIFVEGGWLNLSRLMSFRLSPERMRPHQHPHPALVDVNTPLIYTNCQIYNPYSLS